MQTIKSNAIVSTLLASCLALSLAACETMDAMLFQSFAGEQPGEPVDENKPEVWTSLIPKDTEESARLAPQAGSGPDAPPALGSDRYRPAPVTMQRDPGSPIAQNMKDLTENFAALRRDAGDRDAELQQLRAALSAKLEDYAAAKASLASEASADGWRQARVRLGLVDLEVDRMMALASKVEIDGRSANQLAESARAARGLSEATAGDREQLTQLAEEAGKLGKLFVGVQRAADDDAKRQFAYATEQRGYLIQVGRRIGQGETGATAAATAAPRPAATPASLKNRRPLVTIRFGEGEGPYDEPLYEAISYAIEKRPDVQFDVLALVPSAGDVAETTAQSQQRVDEVLGKLAAMGVPDSRIRVSAETDAAIDDQEVRIYVR